MKNVKKLIGFVILFTTVILVSNTRSLAAEVQYTDNVIPAMTSNTSPSGEASASSFWSTNTNMPAYLAFDYNSSTLESAWASQQGTTSGWLCYEFSSAKCITKYTMVSRNPVNAIGEMPKDWTFEALNIQTNKWVVLDTHSNVTDWSVGVKKEFVFENTESYSDYRINVTSNGGGNVVLVIGEVEMMETVSTPNTEFLGNKADIKITMITGEIKEYNLDIAEVEGFITWYENRTEGIGKEYYKFTKINASPYLGRKEYIIFDKISSFEIMDYNE